jgi:hypothetical protein
LVVELPMLGLEGVEYLPRIVIIHRRRSYSKPEALRTCAVATIRAARSARSAGRGKRCEMGQDKSNDS